GHGTRYLHPMYIRQAKQQAPATANGDKRRFIPWLCHCRARSLIPKYWLFVIQPSNAVALLRGTSGCLIFHRLHPAASRHGRMATLPICASLQGSYQVASLLTPSWVRAACSKPQAACVLKPGSRLYPGGTQSMVQKREENLSRWKPRLLV